MNENAKPRGRSLAKKLSGRMFWRMLGIFISVDILLVLIFSASVIAVCELSAAERLRRNTEMYIVDADAFEQLPGYVFPDAANWIFPAETRHARRQLAASNGSGEHSRLSYVIYVQREDGSLGVISYNLERVGDVAVWAFRILLAFELIALISKTAKSSRMFRRALDPIYELARATQTLSATAEVMDKRGGEGESGLAQMRGALEEITPGKLHTRIDAAQASPEMRDLAAAINGMLDRVENAYAAQRQFVSDASHELRTPIAVIQGYAGLLDRWGKHDEKTLQEAINAIRAESESMKRLVEQLLFLARADSGGIKREETRFDLGVLADELENEARLIDSAHEYIETLGSAFVKCDRDLLKEALRAILDNASKYTDAGGTITLKSFAENGRAVITITDTGMGISPEILPKIFGRFVRADDARDRASGGAGLGLAIAREIVSACGGTIEIVSRVGIGTRMIISLPAA